MQSVPESNVETIKTLYTNHGLSAREIAEQLGYSIDAIYYVMRKYSIQRRNRGETNRIRFEKKPPTFHVEQILSEEENDLKIAGTMLYWAEGYKTEKSKGIDFANSDIDMQILFLKFLRQICNIDESKLRVHLYSHSKESIGMQITYWSNQLMIPKKQFTKPYINSQTRLDKKNKMPYGLVHIRYFDKKLLRQILDWIEEYKTNT